MNALPPLDLADFQYELPEDRIAKFPLAERDQSRLLVYKAGSIAHSTFRQLADFLPVNSTLYFNDTRVIPARLLFEKPTGGTIEVFLLNPAGTRSAIAETMTATSPVTWQCTVGNAKRWPDSMILNKVIGDVQVTASWKARSKSLVNLAWTPASIPFATVVHAAGAVPLPPYLNRPAEAADRERYQTVYSRFDGAVAAPTAGLHFTPFVLSELEQRGFGIDFLTLHVSAGTFLPIKVQDVAAHRMHQEEIIIRKRNIINLLDHDRPVIAVGTTALRTLESLYWYGVRLAAQPDAPFEIHQDLPFQEAASDLSRTEAISLVLAQMERSGRQELSGHTAIYVVPGYRFRMTDGLVTNFHQPGSSLMVLVSAFIGASWRDVYREALSNGYRFLSYGDSSLLLP